MRRASASPAVARVNAAGCALTVKIKATNREQLNRNYRGYVNAYFMIYFASLPAVVASLTFSHSFAR